MCYNAYCLLLNEMKETDFVVDQWVNNSLMEQEFPLFFAIFYRKVAKYSGNYNGYYIDSIFHPNPQPTFSSWWFPRFFQMQD